MFTRRPVEPKSDRLLFTDLLIVCGLAAAVFFTNLGVPALWDRDEPRNAGCAREMMKRHDWIVPTFNAELRGAKPALQYWFMISAYYAFGDTEFSARFWSAMLSIGTVLLTARLGSLLAGPRVGFWSAIILSTSLMMGMAARIATPDAYLIFFTTASIYTFAWGARSVLKRTPETGSETGTSRIPWTAAVIMYCLLGMNVLAKGPIGWLGPIAIIHLSLWCRQIVGEGVFRSAGTVFRSCWRTIRYLRPVAGLLIVLVVSAPWYIAVTLATDGQWFIDFFLNNNLSRALTAMEKHAGPWWYYAPAILAGFFPWSVVMMPLIVDLWRRVSRERDAADVLCVTWVVVWVAGFTLARTKLPSYVTPCYPALAILTGRYIVRWQEGTLQIGSVFSKAPLVCYGLVGVIIGVAFLGAGYAGFGGLEPLAVLGLILGVSAVTSLWFARLRRIRPAVGWFCAGCVLFSFSFHGLGSPRVAKFQRAEELLQTVDQRTTEPRFASYGCLEPSWVYYAGRPIHEFRANEAEAASRFLNENAQNYLVTTNRKYLQIQSELPPETQVIARESFFLKPHEQLVVLNVGPAGTQATQMSEANGPSRR